MANKVVRFFLRLIAGAVIWLVLGGLAFFISRGMTSAGGWDRLIVGLVQLSSALILVWPLMVLFEN